MYWSEPSRKCEVWGPAKCWNCKNCYGTVMKMRNLECQPSAGNTKFIIDLLWNCEFWVPTAAHATFTIKPQWKRECCVPAHIGTINVTFILFKIWAWCPPYITCTYHIIYTYRRAPDVLTHTWSWAKDAKNKCVCVCARNLRVWIWNLKSRNLKFKFQTSNLKFEILKYY